MPFNITNGRGALRQISPNEILNPAASKVKAKITFRLAIEGILGHRYHEVHGPQRGIQIGSTTKDALQRKVVRSVD